MGEPALEMVVGDDGSVHVDAERLRRLGLRPGDNVRILPARRRRIRSRLGARERALGFSDDHLREVRREMGDGTGEGLER